MKRNFKQNDEKRLSGAAFYVSDLFIFVTGPDIHAAKSPPCGGWVSIFLRNFKMQDIFYGLKESPINDTTLNPKNSLK